MFKRKLMSYRNIPINIGGITQIILIVINSVRFVLFVIYSGFFRLNKLSDRFIAYSGKLLKFSMAGKRITK